MKATAGPPFRVVLYEGNGSQPLGAARKNELLLSLLGKGYAVTVSRAGGQVSDAGTGTLLVLGQFDKNASPESRYGGAAAAKDADKHASACHSERGEESLPVASGETPSTSSGQAGGVQLEIRDIAGLETSAVLAMVESVRTAAQGPRAGTWKPWFPVIDFGRCTNCMQCLSFCLFDVYGVSTGGKIQVQNQDNCKTDCPACSRVCPEVAILFPKYRFGPVNGDEINPDDLRREAMKVDISALLGGDIYAALRDRSERAKSRFSKERDEDRALKERQRCLEKLQQAMDIPTEVLASLPSVDQIQIKAREAKARAEAALRANAEAKAGAPVV